MEPSEAVRLREQEEDAKPEERPTSEAELKFRPANAVQWFSPNVLADAGLRVLISSAFGAFLDKRELQASVGIKPHAHNPPLVHRKAGQEVWLDFVADTGDGFNATYTVAWLGAQPELHLTNWDTPLPRADLLLLGGDEVYPVGNPEAYETKLRGPYRSALPWLPPDQTPELYAIPGNHDWYDGLTSFFRVFCQQRWIGGRQTCQTRSYFAIQLPHRWWIWGIDIQLDSYVDEPQKKYFRDEVDLREDDRVILLTATPSWYDGPESQGYKNLDFIEKELISKRNAHLMLTLSGDSHHYAHYDGGDGTHKVTAGGGGAFTHPTHPLGKKPLRLAMSQEELAKDQKYEQKATYPDRRTSRLMALGAVGLPLFNPTFMFVPAVVYVLLAWSAQFSLRAFDNSASLENTASGFGAGDVVVGLFRNPVSVLMLVVFGFGLLAFAKPSPKRKKKWERNLWKVPMALLHLTLHLVAVVAAALIAAKLASSLAEGGWQYTLWLLVAMGVLGGVLGGLATGIYLGLCCTLFSSHGNEAFSAMRLTSHKNFLRICLENNGDLTIYPIGVRRSRKWEFDRDSHDVSAPWYKPRRQAPEAHLIEKPISLSRRSP